MIRNLLLPPIPLFVLVAVSCSTNMNSDGLKHSDNQNSPCFTCADKPIGAIFCDDFEGTTPLTERYFEYNSQNGSFVKKEGVGRHGSAGMVARWSLQNPVNAGDLKKSIGKSNDPYLLSTASNPEKIFTEIYWRIDVRFQPGFKGGTGEKLTRATSLMDGWKQGMIAHVWSHGSKKNFLITDPASGIDEQGIVKSTKYNDFENLRWLGRGTVGTFDWFSEDNDGKWHCVVAHVKLNTPGKSDGVFEFWINNELQSRQTNLNWHGKYDAEIGINAIFFENYWNAPGSPVEQERYFDNIVISTKKIHCDCSE
jgi:hypothetical protein